MVNFHCGQISPDSSVVKCSCINTPQLASMTGKADATIERHTALLRKNNLIEHRGAAKIGWYYPL